MLHNYQRFDGILRFLIYLLSSIFYRYKIFHTVIKTETVKIRKITSENTGNKIFVQDNDTSESPWGELNNDIQNGALLLRSDKINRKVFLLSEEMVEHYQQPDMD